MEEEKEVCFCYEIEIKPIKYTNVVSTRINIESLDFITEDFYKDFSSLIEKHIQKTTK